jgi:hypothetical protein
MKIALTALVNVYIAKFHDIIHQSPLDLQQETLSREAGEIVKLIYI